MERKEKAGKQSLNNTRNSVKTPEHYRVFISMAASSEQEFLAVCFTTVPFTPSVMPTDVEVTTGTTKSSRPREILLHSSGCSVTPSVVPLLPVWQLLW